MKTVVTTTDEGKGFSYYVYFGCEVDNNGVVQTETADRVKSGWASTRDKAAQIGSDVAHKELEKASYV